MGAPTHNFTRGSFDEAALCDLLAEEGFVESFAGCMNLLGTCFVESPKTPAFKQAFDAVCALVSAGEWPFGEEDAQVRVRELLDRAQREDDEAFRVRAYTRLFRGPAKLPAPPWGSVYMDRDQVMYGWTWVELRTWMRAQGISGTYAENDPEDHFGRMLALAAVVAQSRPEVLGEFLSDHLLCWSSRFLDAFQPAAGIATYEALAELARVTLDDVSNLAGIVPARRRMYR